MRRFYTQQYVKFSFKEIKHTTDKAYLFKIEENILIWVPKSWITKLNKKTFLVKQHLSGDIKLKIKAEKKALK